MAVNMQALSASISNAVQQLLQRQWKRRHSVHHQSVANVVNASLAEITQGTPPRSENVVTLAEPGLDLQAPKQFFSSVAVSVSSRVSSKDKAKIWSNEYLDFGTLLSFSPNNQKFSLSLASSDGETTRPQLTLEPSQPVKKILTIKQWLSAFNIFVAIYSEKLPTDTPKVMKYCEIVRDIAARWLAVLWRTISFHKVIGPCAMPMGRYSLGTLAKGCDKFSSENPIFVGQGTTALPLPVLSKRHMLVGVSMRVRCAPGAVSNTFAISVAQNTLPHSVPPVNLKHTSSKQVFQTLHKPVKPVKVDRLNFLLSGYETSLRLYLVNGFTFGFHVGFDGERCALHSPNLKSALDQLQIVRTKLRKECETRRICGPLFALLFPTLFVLL